MSHLPLSLMNILSKSESAVFKLWMLYFQRIFSTEYLDTTTAVVVLCGGPKKLPVHRYSVVIFIFSGPLGLGVQHVYLSRIFFFFYRLFVDKFMMN